MELLERPEGTGRAPRRRPWPGRALGPGAVFLGFEGFAMERVTFPHQKPMDVLGSQETMRRVMTTVEVD
eukprot:2613494-Pyramimonas_sp.AAC.1